METQVLPSEESAGAFPRAADSVPPTAFTTIPACRSVPSSAQSPLPPKEAEDFPWGCTACGRVAESLHRLRKDEAVSNLCSACILLLYKRMYCCLCFVVYENSAEHSDPTFWLTCSKCQRMSHLACAYDRKLSTDPVTFTCSDCSKLEKAPTRDTCTSTGGMAENGSPHYKKLRVASDEKTCPNEALAAAHIVAFVAVKQAKDAKARARVLARVAASAAVHAKAALDTAYMVALEEARWKPKFMNRFPGVLCGKNRVLPSIPMLNAPRISRADGKGSLSHVPNLRSYSVSRKDP